MTAAILPEQGSIALDMATPRRNRGVAQASGLLEKGLKRYGFWRRL
jgi:hypothetical protein